MTPAAVISFASTVALTLMCAAFFLAVYRVVRGPTLPDRIVALDMLVAIAIGFIAVIAIRTGYALYVDIAISLGLVGFLATVAFARFVLSRGIEQGGEDVRPVAAGKAGGRRPARRARKGRKG